MTAIPPNLIFIGAGYEVTTTDIPLQPGSAEVRREVRCPAGKKAIGAGWRQTKTPPERLALWESGPSDDNAGWVFSVANDGFKETTVRVFVISAGGVQFGGSAPVATAVPASAGGKAATVEFDTPTPPGDPVRYTVKKTIGNTEDDATLKQDPATQKEETKVVGTKTTLTVINLTTGDSALFKVTATSGTTTATSQPSLPITVE